MIQTQKPVTTCIIDDDKIFIFGFKKLLQIKGVTTDVQDFNNGKEALDFLCDPTNHNNLPDIIFLDINMPVMDGWEFAAAFGELQTQLGKHIIVYKMSSSIDEQDIRRAKSNPLIKDYIVKPITDKHLAQIFDIFKPGFDNINYN